MGDTEFIISEVDKKIRSHFDPLKENVIRLLTKYDEQHEKQHQLEIRINNVEGEIKLTKTDIEKQGGKIEKLEGIFNSIDTTQKEILVKLKKPVDEDNNKRLIFLGIINSSVVAIIVAFVLKLLGWLLKWPI